MAVGVLEQTVTVSGEAPIIDVQGTARQSVIEHEIVDVRESAFDTAGISAEFSSGGVHSNIIPKDGGNRPEGTLFYAFANSRMQSSNITQELIDRGLPTQGAVRRKTTDFNPGFGGRLRADRLWYFVAGLYRTNSKYTPGMFENANFNNPNAWAYIADVNRRRSATRCGAADRRVSRGGRRRRTRSG